MLNNNKLIKFKSKKIKQKSFWFKRKKPLRSLKPVRLISIRQYHWKPDKTKEKNYIQKKTKSDIDYVSNNAINIQGERKVEKESKELVKEKSYSKESKLEKLQSSKSINKKYLIKDIIFFILTIIANYCIFVLYFDDIVYWFLSYVVYMLIIIIFRLDRFKMANTIFLIIFFLLVIVVMYKIYNYIAI